MKTGYNWGVPFTHTVEICAALAGAGTVLLPHPFAAQQVRAHLAGLPQSSPDIPAPLAWSEWTASLWSSLLLDGGDDRILLNRLQEEQLWAEVIAESAAGRDLSQDAVRDPAAVRDLAQKARTALHLAAEHRVLPRLAEAADTADSRVFAGWWEQFREHCRLARLLPAALLEEALGVHLRSGALGPIPSLHLVGFGRTTPSQDFLLQTLEACGVTLGRHQPGSQNATPAATGSRLAAVLPDVKEELRCAVRLLATASADGARTPRLALILPHASDHRVALERLFGELLAPELQSVLTDLSSSPWHFSQQPPLSSVALVQDALALLQWAGAPLPLDAAAHVLRSPFVGGAPLLSLPPLPRWLPPVSILRGTVALPDLLPRLPRAAWLSDAEAERGRALAALLAAAQDRSGSRGSQRSAGDWADEVRRLLRAAGWPGARSLSPAEFRAMQTWEGLLDQLSTLQFGGNRTSFASFLARLVAETSRSALSSPAPGVPVQVLSLDEAEGLTFDLAIHVDATDRNLPPPARRQPLLPLGLQRHLGFGDPQTAAADALSALQNLATRSGTLLLLAPRATEDGEAGLTELAPALQCATIESETLLGAELAPPAAETELIVDPSLPAVPEGTLLRGGVEVLKRQAACGFHAFASFRLGAEDAPRQAVGLTPQESGSLLHGILQRIWSNLESQQALRAMPPTSREALVRQSVEEGFAARGLDPHAADPWARRYLLIARRRFVTLLLGWLETELERSPFVVLAQEEKQELALGPVRFSLRPDRVDLNEEGGVVLVDYKTSYDLRADHWLGDRPEAPQLPAYALCRRDQPLAGIAFAQVRSGKDRRWIGLAEAPGTVLTKGKKVKLAVLDEQTEFWREQLTELASAFAAGDTRVNPKEYPHTCRYCAHRLLCRLDPSTLLAEDELEEDEAEGYAHV